MAQIQKVSFSGEMTQRFIEFVIMQAQHAALFLGQVPNPQTGEVTVNLEAATLFIGQLEMISEKTRGNLNSDEAHVLESTLASLHEAFLQITHYKPDDLPQESSPTLHTPAPDPAPPASSSVISSAPEADNKKRFTKSYGA